MLSIALAALAASADPQSNPPAFVPCEQPQSMAGEQLPSTTSTVDLVKAWLDAMHRSDDAAFIRFVQERGPVLLGPPEQWLELRNMLRDLRFCGVKSADAARVDLWAFDPNIDSYAVAQFKLGAKASDKISFAGIWLTGEVPPGTPTPPKLDPAMLIKAVQARASSELEQDRFSGALLIAKRGQVLLQKAYGYANRETRTPNDLNTQFRFGSMGKMFTIIAIMQLVQDGKVDPSAPIGRYLANYPNQDVATKVTVANLLTHTGGTGDIFGPDFDAHKSTLRDLKDYVALYGKRSPEFAPGSRFAYSNYGFILLGRIVEEVTGLSYDAYLQRNIFDPAGMHATGNLPESTILPHRAVGYMGSGAKLRRADETLPLRGTSAGGGYSTVGDFNRFVEALVSHRLLRAATLQQLIDGGIKTSDGQFMRYDFGGVMPGAGRFIGHGGGAPGMNGALYHFLDSGYTVIVLANRDPAAADGIATFAAHRLPAH